MGLLQSLFGIKKEIELVSPLAGKVVLLEKVEDMAFSQKMLGNGIAIEPKEGKLFAPCDGKIDMIFDTKHAINLVTKDGAEVLLHVGLETVKLGGKPFVAHVKAGQNVKKGDLLLEFDIDEIKNSGCKTTTPMVICNSDNYASFTILTTGDVKAGDKLLLIKK